MRELLPLGLGVIAGLAVSAVPARWRALGLLLGAVAAGLLASAINGELASEGWAAFVSFDVLLAWAGATTTLVATTSRRWMLAWHQPRVRRSDGRHPSP